MIVLSFDPGLISIRIGHGRVRAKVTELGCWEVFNYRNKQGYGQMRYVGKIRHIHRVTYAEQNGIEIDDLDGILIRHRCDNPPCCNPEHLEEGDYQDNANDRESRGRAVYLPGERNGQSKLTESQVLAIRNEVGTLKSIGEKYGVSLSMIHLIKSRKKWRHLK